MEQIELLRLSLARVAIYAYVCNTQAQVDRSKRLARAMTAASEGNKIQLVRETAGKKNNWTFLKSRIHDEGEILKGRGT